MQQSTLLSKTRMLGVALTFLAAMLPVSGVYAQDLSSPYAVEAERVVQRLRGAMMSELKDIMELPPAEAVALCRHLAPEIKEEIEAETGWQVRRVALRVRVPENAPTDEERGILLGFDVRSAAGQPARLLRTERAVEREGRPHVLFMQAIPTFETCLVCHGRDLDPEVDEALRELYPDDEATGHVEGDVRGAFALYKPLPEAPGPDVAPLPAPPPASVPTPWLEQLGYTPSVRPGAVGNSIKGVEIYDRNCKHCHAPDDLARHILAPDTAMPEKELCLFLETHGLRGEPGACDVAAFLHDLALFLAKGRQ